MLQSFTQWRMLPIVIACWLMSTSGCGDVASPAHPALGDSVNPVAASFSWFSRRRIASVTVSITPDTLMVGRQATAHAVALSLRGDTISNQSIMWSSTDTTVAKVSQAGTVNGVAGGQARIIARVNGVSGSMAVIVVSDSSPTPAPVAAVSVVLPAATLNVGATMQPAAVLKDGQGNVLTGRVVSWSSSNSAIASVNVTTGLITGTAAGTVSISAVSEGITGSASLTIQAVTASVAKVTVALASSTIAVGGTTTASATLTDSTGQILTGRTVTWSSSNASVATVNATSGLVQAIAAGTAAIVATSGGKTGQATVTVAAPVVSATKLAIITQPSASAASGSPLGQQPVIQLQNANSTAVSQSGMVVTAAIASGSGTLGGTTTATTNASGVATFSNLAITGATATETLSFSASGLTGVTSSAIALSGGSGSTGGSGTPAVPNIYPTDGSYGWVFNGSTAAAQSGAFVTADLSTSFLGGSGYYLAPTAGPNGIAAVRADFQPTTGNGGTAFYYPLATPRKQLYVRWFYKQSNPFNTNGTQSNQDYAKMLRLWTPGLNSIILTPVASPGGQMQIDWDSWDSNTTPPYVLPGASWNYNSHLGTWNCYEVFIDLTVPNSAHTTIWVNNTQVLDHTVTGSAVASASTSIGTVQITGVINSIASPSSAWVTMVGVSSQRMGCPPGFSLPQ